MIFRKFTRKLLYMILLLNIIIISFNIIINPYKIFNLPDLTINNITNHIISDRITKFYSCKRMNPNVLMMGTSRMGAIHPKYLQKYVRGNIYNLSLGGSHISEQYYYLKYFIDHNKINTIILGLDFMSFFKVKNNLYEKTHFNFERLNSFYVVDYIKAMIGKRVLIDSWNTFLDNIKKEAKNKKTFDNGWVTHYQNYDDYNRYGVSIVQKRIMQKLLSYSHGTLSTQSLKRLNKYILDKNIQYVKKLSKLCKKKKIELKMFISPTYFKHTELIYLQGFGNYFQYWKTELAKIHPLYDFSGENTITKNAENYMDASHFNSNIGQLIFARMYNDKSIYVPIDFGLVLTRDNIDKKNIFYRFY